MKITRPNPERTQRYEPPPECEVCDGTGVVVLPSVVSHAEYQHDPNKPILREPLVEPQLADVAYGCRCSAGKKAMPRIPDRAWETALRETARKGREGSVFMEGPATLRERLDAEMQRLSITKRMPDGEST